MSPVPIVLAHHRIIWVDRESVIVHSMPCAQRGSGHGKQVGEPFTELGDPLGVLFEWQLQLASLQVLSEYVSDEWTTSLLLLVRVRSALLPALNAIR